MQIRLIYQFLKYPIRKLSNIIFNRDEELDQPSKFMQDNMHFCSFC